MTVCDGARWLLAVAAVGWGATRGHAGDWPQWRGPERTGVATSGPALATQWPASGPIRLWESDPVPSAHEGGFGSPILIGQRVFLYVNWKTYVPIPQRVLHEDALRQLGWFPEKAPADLMQAVEAARVSPERAALASDALKNWIGQWVTNHIGADAAQKPFEALARSRLMKGTNALPLDVGAKLGTLRDREFSDAAALEAWCASNDIPPAVRVEIARATPTTKQVASDVILCLDRANGKEIWKREFPGKPSDWGSSSAPAFADGRLFVAGAHTLYGLKADNGAPLWQAPLKGGEVSSSPLVAGGLVVVQGGVLAAFAAADGKPLWQQPAVSGNNPSPMLWTDSNGVSRVIANCAKGLICVATNDGRVLWTAPGGGSSTPVVAGDMAVLFGGGKDPGLAAWRMTPERAEKAWSIPISDRGATPVVAGGYVYAVGGGKSQCARLADGHVMWETPQRGEIASPILADGKIVASVEGGGALVMFRASPDAYSPLARAAIKHASCTTPSSADGQLFLRLADRVACYDLTR